MQRTATDDENALAQRLFNAADHVIRGEGLQLGEGADGYLRERAELGAHEINVRSGGDLSSVTAHDLIRKAENNFERFAQEMLNARQEISDDVYLARNVAGEQTLDAALRKLCPIWPIC